MLFMTLLYFYHVLLNLVIVLLRTICIMSNSLSKYINTLDGGEGARYWLVININIHHHPHNFFSL